MRFPRLLHPVPIVLKQSDKDNTFHDPQAREPIQIVKRKPTVTVPGQVLWKKQYRATPSKTGIVENSDGYILFRKVDLDVQGLTLSIQDRITKMGHVETDVYIVSLEWVSHYQTASGPTMVKAHFVDRQPSRQSRG